MERDLEALRRRTENLPTEESRTSLESDANAYVQDSGGHGWKWLRWHRSARAWCALHDLECADAFSLWPVYQRTSRKAWTRMWCDWTQHFIERIVQQTPDSDTENRILWQIWVEWSATMKELRALGWDPDPDAVPEGWDVVLTFVDRWRPPPTAERLVDHFEFKT